MILKHLKFVPVRYWHRFRGIRPREIGGALVVVLVSALVLAMPSAQAQGQAPTYSILYSFQCSGSNGGFPAAGLIRDTAGNLYGTTFGGGTAGFGTAFELSAIGIETVLHSFDANQGDGSEPEAGLVRDPAGNLYGTTVAGGINTAQCSAGCGTVFKLAPSGRETLLHSFAGPPADGQGPLGGLVPDASGNLYGTTSLGGANFAGMVFKVTRTGAETVLYSFKAGTMDGAEPMGTLVRDTAGNLYGTTLSNGAFGFGTVFEVTPAGVETVLHSFAGGATDGADPLAGLVRDSGGNLYGSTNVGGTFNGGIIFKLDPTGAETILFNFNGTNQGFAPLGLAQDAKGNLFGVTLDGGSSSACNGGCGVVFELSTTGQEAVLHSFTAQPDGKFPAGGPALDNAGNLYGVTNEGGTGGGSSGGCGTVFKLAR